MLDLYSNECIDQVVNALLQCTLSMNLTCNHTNILCVKIMRRTTRVVIFLGFYFPSISNRSGRIPDGFLIAAVDLGDLEGGGHLLDADVERIARVKLLDGTDSLCRSGFTSGEIALVKKTCMAGFQLGPSE